MDEQDSRLESERAVYRRGDAPGARGPADRDAAWSTQATDLTPTAAGAGVSGSAAMAPAPTGAAPSGAEARPDSAASSEDDDPQLRTLQAEVADARDDLAQTLGAIEEKLTPSAIASAATATLSEKAAEVGTGVAESRPGRYARANPWRTVLVLTGTVVALWLAAKRRPSRRRRARPLGREGAQEFARTHYDAGTEHTLERRETATAGAPRGHAQTHGGTTA